MSGPLTFNLSNFSRFHKRCQFWIFDFKSGHRRTSGGLGAESGKAINFSGKRKFIMGKIQQPKIKKIVVFIKRKKRNSFLLVRLGVRNPGFLLIIIDWGPGASRAKLFYFAG